MRNLSIDKIKDYLHDNELGKFKDEIPPNVKLSKLFQ